MHDIYSFLLLDEIWNPKVYFLEKNFWRISQDCREYLWRTDVHIYCMYIKYTLSISIPSESIYTPAN